MVANASSIALVPFEVEEVLQTVYTIERYPTFYDTATCLAENVTYTNRVDQPGALETVVQNSTTPPASPPARRRARTPRPRRHPARPADSFGFCSVPLSAADTFLFASVALLLAGLLANKLSAVWLLLAGGAVGVLNHYVNLGRVSNAIALWLHISPPYLFWYAFLPPLLVDAAMRLDFYTFGKLWVNVVLLAFPLVILSVVTLAPFVLFALGFQGRGWDWVHGALLAAVLAPTDAVSVTAILKAGGGPEFMSVLMEGEALLNDASGGLLLGAAVLLRGAVRGAPRRAALGVPPPALTPPPAACPPARPSCSHHHVRDLLQDHRGVRRQPPRRLVPAAPHAAHHRAPGGGGHLHRVRRRRRGVHLSAAPCSPRPCARHLACARAVTSSRAITLPRARARRLVAGLLTMPLLRWMRWRGLPAVAEVCFTLGMSYLAFYVAQGPLTVRAQHRRRRSSGAPLLRAPSPSPRPAAPWQHRPLLGAGSPAHRPRPASVQASGVFAVVTYGIYSSATSRFGMLSNDAASAVHETVWDTVAFVANGLVFFWSGISSVNLIIRSTGVLHTGWSYGAIPLIFIFSFVQRGACILLFNPLHKMTHVGEGEGAARAAGRRPVVLQHGGSALALAGGAAPQLGPGLLDPGPWA
jgi:hypothetical protein